MKKRILPRINVNGLGKGFGRQEQARRHETHAPKHSFQNYWQDPVYQHLAALKREAQASQNIQEISRLDNLMLLVVESRLPEEERTRLMEERKKRKLELKRKRKQEGHTTVHEKTIIPEMDIAALKRRIFSKHTSPENMIECLEKLPKPERDKTIARLPNFFKRKIISYLRQRGYM